MHQEQITELQKKIEYLKKGNKFSEKMAIFYLICISLLSIHIFLLWMYSSGLIVNIFGTIVSLIVILFDLIMLFATLLTIKEDNRKIEELKKQINSYYGAKSSENYEKGD